MKKKFCARCEKETWQNPLKLAGVNKEQNYRCTQCGFPIRTGGNAKNFGVLMRMKIMHYGPGEKVV